VSLYTTGLSSTDVSSHYQSLQSQDVPSEVTPPAAPPVNTQTITVTDPYGKTAKYVYPSGALIRAVSVLGGVTTYGYDTALRAATITDPDGDTTYMTYDAHNNVTFATTCAAVNNCQTSYASYYENLSNPLDPGNDKPADSRDARSSSPSDPAYDTVTTYTAAAQIATRTMPPTAACPSGCKTSYAYTTGSEPAVGGGTEPPCLLASTTSPNGGATSYAYDSAGDVMQTTDPLGLATKYANDNLGRPLTETQISDSYPAGLTTSYTYDGQDQLLTETDPARHRPGHRRGAHEGDHRHLRRRLQRADQHDQRRHRGRPVPDHHQYVQLTQRAGLDRGRAGEHHLLNL
jgi:YD repeat-containing protein